MQFMKYLKIFIAIIIFSFLAIVMENSPVLMQEKILDEKERVKPKFRTR